MIVHFDCHTWHMLQPGDPVYFRSPGEVTAHNTGAYVGTFHSSFNRERIAVVIVPITVEVHKVEHSSLVVDPHVDRRKEYQALGCSYTQASDLAVTDYVDAQLNAMAHMVDALAQLVQARTSKKGGKRGKKAKKQAR